MTVLYAECAVVSSCIHVGIKGHEQVEKSLEMKKCRRNGTTKLILRKQGIGKCTMLILTLPCLMVFT